ncbi:hypothetical protein [Bacillus sp. NPDC094106]|uniref:hypothetical protein n=1 Tax=Bacillus sp. NPDC094106 TaxID=3363949 RepID=UPI003824B6CA
MKFIPKYLAVALGCSFLLFGCSSSDNKVEKEVKHQEKESVTKQGIKPVEELIYKQVDSRDDGYKDYYYRVYYNHANKCVTEQHMVQGAYGPIMTSNYLLDGETKQPMCGKSLEEAKALFQAKEK